MQFYYNAEVRKSYVPMLCKASYAQFRVVLGLLSLTCTGTAAEDVRGAGEGA